MASSKTSGWDLRVPSLSQTSGRGSPFEAVIFDLFGTLVPEFSRSDFDDSVRGMARILQVDPDAFQEGWYATAIPRQTGGFEDMAENVRHICTTLGIAPDQEALDDALDLRMGLYRKWFYPRAGALETLRVLKERGYPVALISMCAPDTPDLWRASPLAPYVDVEVFSSGSGLRKPDAAIYLLACERLGVIPERCLYCGDGAYAELTGVAAVGMTAYWIRDPDLDPSESLRPEGEDWTGPAVDDLRELLQLLPALG